MMDEKTKTKCISCNKDVMEFPNYLYIHTVNCSGTDPDNDKFFCDILCIRNWANKSLPVGMSSC